MIFAFDIGLCAGIAYGKYTSTVRLGTFDVEALAKEMNIERQGGKKLPVEFRRLVRRAYEPRVIIWYEYLRSLPPGATCVVWEDVLFHSGGVYAQQLWASLRTAIWLAYYHCDPIPHMTAIPSSRITSYVLQLTKLHGLSIEASYKQLVAPKTKFAPIGIKHRRIIAAHLLFPKRFSKIQLEGLGTRISLYDSFTNEWHDHNAVDAFWLWHWAKTFITQTPTFKQYIKKGLKQETEQILRESIQDDQKDLDAFAQAAKPADSAEKIS